MRERRHSNELSGLARRRRQRSDAAFQRRNALLEDCDRRVADPAVDVAEFLEPEEARAVGRVVECEGLGVLGLYMICCGGEACTYSRSIYRHSARIRRGIRSMTCPTHQLQLHKPHGTTLPACNCSVSKFLDSSSAMMYRVLARFPKKSYV
jgi:hypothetical protein